MSWVQQTLLSIETDSGKKRIAPEGVTDETLPIDLAEIFQWAEALRLPESGRLDLLNLFFCPLPSGAFQIGRLTGLDIPAMASKRRRRFFLQSLILSPETLFSFGNNPVLAYQKALGTGKFSFVTRPSASVEPLDIRGDNLWLDASLLRGMAVSPGTEALAALVGEVLRRPCAVFSGGPPAIHVLSALLNLLPIDCRSEISFSAGLHFCSERTPRVVGLSKKAPLPAEIQEQLPFPILNMEAEFEPSLFGWSALVREILSTNRLDFLFRVLLEDHIRVEAKKESGAMWFSRSGEELDRFGQQLRETLRTLPPSSLNLSAGQRADDDSAEDFRQMGRIFRVKKTPTESEMPRLSISEKLKRWLLETEPDEKILYYSVDRETAEPRDGHSSDPEIRPLDLPRLESDVAGLHSKRHRLEYEEPLLVVEGENHIFSPFQRLLADWPQEETRLQELDSLVAHAIANDYRSAENLEHFWRRFIGEVSEELAWSVREEYIHFIQSILTWQGDSKSVKSPKKSLSALEILELFINESPIGR